MVRCYIMSENTLNNLELLTYELQVKIEGMRKSNQREELLKSIRKIKAALNSNDNIFEVNTDDSW